VLRYVVVCCSGFYCACAGVTGLLALAYAASYRIYTTPVLQSVAICCSVLLCVHRSHGTASTRIRGVIRNANNGCIPKCCNVLQCVAVCAQESREYQNSHPRRHNEYEQILCCRVLHYVAVCCSVCVVVTGLPALSSTTS